MAKIKSPRVAADGTYLVADGLVNNGRGQNPKLYARLLPDGRSSLFLRFYVGYQRDGQTTFRKETLKGLFLTTKPRTPIERESNDEVLRLAEKIRQEKGAEFIADREGYVLQKKNKNFLDYFQAYINNYTKKDKRMLQGSLNRFKDFLKDTPEYNKYKESLLMRQLTPDMVEDFADYLNNNGVGGGPRSYFNRFKKVIKYAYEHDEIRKNPCRGIIIRTDEDTLKKEILSIEEIHKLIKTTYKEQNAEIRRAFLFCLTCGLRFCDVSTLTFANIDYSNKILKYNQNKTKGHSSSSGVTNILDDTALSLLGKPAEGQSKNDLIFNLPSANACNKALSNWAKKAGIDKHITWHCARHSCAVNLLDRKVDVRSVQSILGHSSLRMTENYLRAIDKRKAEAISSLSSAIFGENADDNA